MITYVDTSTLIKLVIEEAGSDLAAVTWDTVDAVVAAATLVVEARAALAAAQRAGRLTRRPARPGKDRRSRPRRRAHHRPGRGALIERAADLAEEEALRGYDAVHLAAAVRVGVDFFSSADMTPCRAAQRHGFHVANPLTR